MPYKIGRNLISNLLLYPETGMGYQVVQATTRSQIFTGIAYNAELFIPEQKFEEISKKATYMSYQALLKEAEPESEIISVEFLKSNKYMRKTWLIKTAGAGMAYPQAIGAHEIFKRFSPYENDRRITPERGLLPGTYATTAQDAENIRSGMDAVSRYALPTNLSARYVFTIMPPPFTMVQRGTVQPANNQPGGGAEVILTNGSPPKTVTGPNEIPEK